ncbi:hypothetical protein DFQ27_002185 [Actinomortierella ambigua]|uniref:Uncharacterized protein n=1 Tax=Actinomortierella ambigua TaxID=1343610 RepID=A0A9P6QKY8_9FUNG|nr:hypothetical protein DFQ27_002185 [Actinomortierella ambigua]
MQLFDPILDSIAHAPEDRPASPHGSNAQQRWFRLMLDLLLDPTRWHKLGFALQWAKWLEWEGGIEKKSPTATHTPGITFLLNPLQSSRLNRLLNRLDFGLVSVETLIGCYDTGDWTVLLRADGHSTGHSPAPPQQQAQNDQEVVQTLEHLCLLALYLRHARAVLFPEQPIDAESAEEDRQIQQLVNSILSNKDSAGNPPSTTNHAPWRDAFVSKALRLSPHQDPLQPTQPSKATVFINELLELIRLDKIARDGWMAPLYIAAENMSFLSKFAGQLPASWYSDEFLQTTIRMARQFMATEARDKIRVPLQVQGLASIVTLWSFWMRKTGTETTPNVLGQEMIELMAEMMAVPSLFEGTEARGLFVGCFSGLATGLDKWHAEPIQSQMTKGMVQGLERTRLVVQGASEMDAIQASLATVLKANEATSDTIRQLTTAFVRSFYGGAFHAMVSSEGGGRGRRPSLFTRDMEEESEELFQILRLFQYVVTTRAGLAVVPDKDEESEDAIKKRRRRKNKNKPRKPVQLAEQDWWTALVGGLHDAADDKSAIPLLLATAGVLRAIQHVEDDPPRVDGESLGMIEDFYVGQLGKVLDRSKQHNIFYSDSSLHALAFACSQTVPNLARCKVESIVDRDTLSKILTSVMFSLSEGVVPVDALLRAADAELSVSLHHPLALNNSNSAGEGSAMAWLTRITRSSSLFKEMGRLARTTAMLVESIQDVQEWHGWVRDMLQSLHAFAINIHVAWSRSSLSKLPLVAVAGVDSVRDGSKRGDQLQSQQQQEAERRRRMTGLMFQAFKTILFATVMILGAITEISAQTDRLQLDAELLEAMDELMLETFGYLYFITYAMGGPGTFVVYEELITTLLTRRVTIDPALLLTRTSGVAAEDQQAPKERIYYGALNRWLQATMPRGDLSMDDPVAETRVLYFMNLVERTMMAVDEELLRSQILPLVYPYLIRRVPADAHASNIHKDLFESAHSVILSVLQTKREATGSPPSTSISRELAPYYGKLLLSHYPNEISIDQLRAGYTTLVKALSEIDDGLAWLTVERLLERIHDYDDVLLANSATVTEAMMPEKQSGQQPQQQLQLERIRERGELTLAVVDQLTSLNLIFVESLGQQIRTLLAQEPSVQNRRSLLKCVLDVVGSQAVDQTKREWAVKWYLGLVQDFGGPTEKLSEKKLPSSSLSSTAAANLIEKEATVEASQ